MNKEIEERNKIILKIDEELMIRHGNEKKFKEWEGFDEFSTEAVMIARTQTAREIVDRLAGTVVNWDEFASAEATVKAFRDALTNASRKIAVEYGVALKKQED